MPKQTELNNESKTLFIPLICKASMSKKNIFLKDLKAEEIIDKLDSNYKKLKVTKWLSMYMSLRALIIDDLCNKYLEDNPNTTVIHLGCGLDSRCLRVNQKFNKWYDIDYDNVINMRKEFYESSSKYKLIGSSIIEDKWIEQVEDSSNVLVIMEGLTMYLSEEEIKNLLVKLSNKFSNVHLLFDAYSKKAVKYSKIKNPVNQVSAVIKYGMDNVSDFLGLNKSLEHISTSIIKKDDNNLPFLTKLIFNNIYCGRMSQKLYKIYEFKVEG